MLREEARSGLADDEYRYVGNDGEDELAILDLKWYPTANKYATTQFALDIAGLFDHV